MAVTAVSGGMRTSCVCAVVYPISYSRKKKYQRASRRCQVAEEALRTAEDLQHDA